MVVLLNLICKLGSLGIVLWLIVGLRGKGVIHKVINVINHNG